MLRSTTSSYGWLVKDTKYDADGQPTWMKYGDAAQTQATLGYDPRGRLTSYDLTRGSVPTFSPTARYTAPGTATTQLNLQKLRITLDDAGNPTAINDIATSSQWPSAMRPVSRTIQYDDAYQTRQVAYTYGGGVATQQSPFLAEEGAGSTRQVPVRTSASRVASQTMSYDALGDLVFSDDNAGMRYDRSLGSVTKVPGKPHQLATASGIAAKWDEAGNLVDLRVERPGTCPSGGTSKCTHRFSYEWDEVGQLSRARRWDYAGSTIPASEPVYPDVPASAPTWDLRFAYSQGHRVLKSAAQDGGEALHTAEVFGTLRLAQTEYVASIEDYKNEPVHQSVYLGGVGRLVYDPSLPAPGATPDSRHVFFQAGDHLGSTAVVFDNQTGEVVERTTFQALGGVESDYRPARWGSFREDYKFTGKEEDVEVGLVYFGARYYHPKLGRFASADPLTIHAAGADLNPYAYVGGRVTSQVDPLGLDNETVYVLGSRRAEEWYRQTMLERAHARAESAMNSRSAVGNAWLTALQSVNPNVGVFMAGLRDVATARRAAQNPNPKAAAQGAVVGWLQGNTTIRTNGIPGGSAVAALVSSVLETSLTSTPNDPSYVFARNRAHAGVVAAFAGVTGLAGEAGTAGSPPPRGAGFPGWPKIGETPGGAVGQLTPLSCGAACGEMVSGMPQVELMSRAGVPADPKLLGAAIGGRGGYVGHGALGRLVSTGRPWIAMLRGDRSLHYVVVDGVDGTNVAIRDPWAGGSTYQMSMEGFLDVWDGIAVGHF